MTSTSQSPVATRAALHRGLSLTHSHRIVLAPGPSTRDAAHEDAVWVGSILRLIDDRFRILIWGRGNRVDRVVARAVALKQPDILCVAEPRLKRRISEDELFSIPDAVLFAGSDPQSSDMIARCRSRNLPIVAVAGPLVSANLEGYPNARIVERFSPPGVAEQILQIFDRHS